ncbi:hypothetical protein PhCBS80983_g04128 [Powellomyces hirtus]|uniref:Diacylglycerol O-acyltransferase n=1 Tax=Powellomyces hirtus TaxID=109895 RepID=A0A507E121_9FUNG|nr:hypothetical protein PhCBS80983_g04128 [Powellomyces hirtus]
MTAMDAPRFVDAPALSAEAATGVRFSKPTKRADASGISKRTLANLPDRILQFMAVMTYSSLMYINLAIHLVLLNYWRIVWPFVLCYWTYVFLLDMSTPYTGGTDRARFFRDWSFWRHFRDYFSAELVKTADLDPEGNFLFGHHPHGIYCYGLLPNFITDWGGFSKLFPGITLRVTTLDVNWSIPIWREMQMALSAVSVSAKSLKHILTQKGPGWSAMVVIGGAEEALLAYPGTNDIILNRRKGFVKLAIQTGASLVPVFTFGENDLFWQVNDDNAPVIRSYQRRFAKLLTFSVPLMWGRFGLFFLPRKVKLVSVVGKPIPVRQQDSPSREYIAQMHDTYVVALMKLYDDHKEKYAPSRIRDLRIVK